jgi:hypothetical protein
LAGFCQYPKSRKEKIFFKGYIMINNTRFPKTGSAAWLIFSLVLILNLTTASLIMPAFTRAAEDTCHWSTQPTCAGQVNCYSTNLDNYSEETECSEACSSCTKYFKIENEQGQQITEKTYTGPNNFEVKLSNFSKKEGDEIVGFDWSDSTYGVKAVVVMGGGKVNIYTYSPFSTGDTCLVSPQKNNKDIHHEISHITFCYTESSLQPSIDVRGDPDIEIVQKGATSGQVALRDLNSAKISLYDPDIQGGDIEVTVSNPIESTSYKVGATYKTVGTPYGPEKAEDLLYLNDEGNNSKALKYSTAGSGSTKPPLSNTTDVTDDFDDDTETYELLIDLSKLSQNYKGSGEELNFQIWFWLYRE